MSRNLALALACAGIASIASSSRAAVVINEIAYDDTGTDNREFVELYNDGAVSVDISGWQLTARDATTVNASQTIPGAAGSGTTILAPGGYYVIGNTGLLNVNQVAPSDFLENDNDSIEIRDAAANLIDALIYETNKGITGNLTGSGLPAQTGSGYFGNSGTTPDLTAPNNTTTSIGRYIDGRDTNNNGRDFGMRPSTPGTSNNAGTMTSYATPDPTGQTLGASVPGLTGAFVNARYIDPTVADANNPNVIPDSPTTPGRAIVAWDPSGGGNAVTSNQVFGTAQGGFNVLAFFDTSDQPQNFNASNVNFTGSEITLYGIGGGDMLSNLTDLGGNVGLGAVALPASESANGTTGLAWVYERTAISGASPATQTLYLVDANDGGDSDTGGNTPLDWTILATIDISGLTSGWFDLGINVDALGNGVANFNGTNYLFTTSPAYHSGAFNVAYRENLQLGADGTPDAIMRPATFTIVPEPSSLALLGLGALALGRRRRA